MITIDAKRYTKALQKSAEGQMIADICINVCNIKLGTGPNSLSAYIQTSPFKPLGKRYSAWKQKKGYSKKPWIRTGKLNNALRLQLYKVGVNKGGIKLNVKPRKGFGELVLHKSLKVKNGRSNDAFYPNIKARPFIFWQQKDESLAAQVAMQAMGDFFKRNGL